MSVDEAKIKALCERMAARAKRPPYAWIDKDGPHFSDDCPPQVRAQVEAAWEESAPEREPGG